MHIKFIFLVISIIFIGLNNYIVLSDDKFFNAIDGNGAEKPQNWLPEGIPTLEDSVIILSDEPCIVNLPMFAYNMTVFSSIECNAPITSKYGIVTYFDSTFSISSNITATVLSNSGDLIIKSGSYFNATLDNYYSVEINAGVIFYRDVINRGILTTNNIFTFIFLGQFITTGGATFLYYFPEISVYGDLIVSDSNIYINEVDKLYIFSYFMFTENSTIEVDQSNLVFTEKGIINDGMDIKLENSMFFFTLQVPHEIQHGLNVTNIDGYYSSISLNNSKFVFIDYAFIVTKNSIIDFNNSTLQSDSSFFYLGDNAQMLASNSSNFFLDDASAFLKDNSFLQIDYSLLVINGSNVAAGCVMNDQSKIEVKSNSTLLINGPLLLYDNSKLILQEHSICAITGSLKIRNDSQFSMVNSTLGVYIGDFTCYHGSELNSIDSIITIQNGGSLIIYDSSLINMENTVLVILNGGVLHNQGREFRAINSSIIIDGSLNSFGLTNANDTEFTISGNILISGVFYGERLNITVLNGNITIQENGSFSCKFCNIATEKGQIISERNTTIILEGSTVKNGGSITSGGQITLQPGSSISNDGEFILSSDIISNQNSLLFNNKGKFKFTNDSKVEVPISSSGEMNIGGNIVEMNKFNQSEGGQFIINGGSIKSESSFDFMGGSVISNNGFLIGNVSNSGAEIGDGNINNLTISGDYHHNPLAKIVFLVENDSDFSKITILNKFIINGGDVIIIINEDYLNSILNKSIISIDLMTFNGSSINPSSLIYNNLENDPTGNSNTTMGSGKITFKTYNKDEPIPKDYSNDNGCVSTASSGSKFSLLLTSCSTEEGSDKSEPITSKAWVAGPILGAVALSAIVILVIVKRERISIFIKLKKESTMTKLKLFKK